MKAIVSIITLFFSATLFAQTQDYERYEDKEGVMGFFQDVGIGVKKAFQEKNPVQGIKSYQAIQKFEEFKKLGGYSDVSSDFRHNEGGSISFEYIDPKDPQTILVGTCTANKCKTTGSVSCNSPNAIATANYGCRCEEGYKMAPSEFEFVCSLESNCAPGTEPIGSPGNIQCQCVNGTVIGENQNYEFCSEKNAQDSCVSTQSFGVTNLAGDCPSTEEEAALAAAEINGKAAQQQQEQINNVAIQEVNQARAACNSFVQNFVSQCNQFNAPTVAGLGSSNSTNEKCESLSNSINQNISTINSKVQSCKSMYSSVGSACPTSTSTGNKPVPQNTQLKAQATAVYASLETKGGEAIAELTKVQNSAKNCSNSFANNAEDNTSGGNLVNSLASAATGILSSLESAKSSDSDELGGGGGGVITPDPSPFPPNPYNTQQGDFSGRYGDGELGKSSPSYGSSLGVGSSGLPDETIYNQTDKKNKGFNTSSPRGGGGGPSGYGSPYSGGYGSGASLPGGGSSNNSTGDGGQKSTRSYASMEKRNLVSGFKTVKASDGGGVLSIKPFDYKKYGSEKLKEKLQEARKLHGKKMPLIFRNGKFVLDFLAMKESEEFKNRNKAMEKFWDGENIDGGKGDLMKLANSEVNPNADHNIFRILHLKYQKQFSRR